MCAVVHTNQTCSYNFTCISAFDDLENDDFAVNSNLIASSSDEEGGGREGEDAEDGDIAR